MFIPKPYVSLHVGGRHSTYNVTLSRIEDILAEALCHRLTNYKFHLISNTSKTSKNILSKVDSCIKENYYKNMYRFEDMDFNHDYLTNTTHLLRSYAVRTNRIKDCNHTYIFI